MTAGLVCKTQPIRIQHMISLETNGVLEGRSADQAHVSHLIQLPGESEGSGGRNVGGVSLRRDVHLNGLVPHQRMLEEDVAGEEKTVGGKDRDAFAGSFDRD